MSMDINVELEITKSMLLFDQFLHSKDGRLERGIRILIASIQILIESVLSVVASVNTISVETGNNLKYKVIYK